MIEKSERDTGRFPAGRARKGETSKASLTSARAAGDACGGRRDRATKGLGYRGRYRCGRHSGATTRGRPPEQDDAKG